MGRAVFIAVVKELSDRGIPTIGLNVSPSNEAARGVSKPGVRRLLHVRRRPGQQANA
jgi:hypothetical protein